MPLELFEGASFKGLDHVGVMGIRDNDVTAVLEHLSPFQILDLHFAADVLGALAPFEFHALHPEFLDRILMNLQAAVFQIGLDDNRAIAILLIVRIKLDTALQIDGIDNVAFFEYGLGIHADHVFPDGQPCSRQGGADGQAFPVVLGDIGGADAGDQPGQPEFNALVMTDGHLQINGGENRFVAVGLDAVRPGGRSHDIEMGVIDGIAFFCRRGDHAKRLGIDNLMAAVCGFSYFTHADATVDAGDAHARRRRDGLFRPVLGEGCAGGIYS